MSHVINNSANTGGLKLCSCKRPRDSSRHNFRSSVAFPLARSLVTECCLGPETVASYHKALYSPPGVIPAERVLNSLPSSAPLHARNNSRKIK